MSLQSRRFSEVSPRATPWGTYTQIAETLRQRIVSGALEPGAVLPSEAALREEFGVARSTIRRALASLEADKLIKARPGTGRVVCGQGGSAEGASGDLPQYRRIADALRDQITRGDFAAGDALPSESALVHQYGVSRGTARRALVELEASGLVVSLQGKGRFVRGADTPRS
ncbi:DNA-binding GntR family transcriptional regulator [Streptomonospora nanhaiensis]|uniref:DNA-binding GntR family transcriptional regulator n=1 Tax=Streptomonospora nanhaiensis TaxID=1323731 RepID=A0A853BPK4_9ACTN|nr:DNA-binding GntR family transcriptional regulator [Streptomonospora nanhaiensis]